MVVLGFSRGFQGFLVFFVLSRFFVVVLGFSRGFQGFLGFFLFFEGFLWLF